LAVDRGKELIFSGAAWPNRLFTADSNIGLYQAASLKAPKMAQITAKIVEIITS
jgi:hypothetical protein